MERVRNFLFGSIRCSYRTERRLEKKKGDRISREPLEEPIAKRGTRGAIDFETLARGFKSALAERMLGAEMDVHPANEAERSAGNHHSGTSLKTVDTASKRAVLDIPQDRPDRFDAVLIAKDQTQGGIRVSRRRPRKRRCDLL